MRKVISLYVEEGCDFRWLWPFLSIPIMSPLDHFSTLLPAFLVGHHLCLWPVTCIMERRLCVCEMCTWSFIPGDALRGEVFPEGWRIRLHFGKETLIPTLNDLIVKIPVVPRRAGLHCSPTECIHSVTENVGQSWQVEKGELEANS